MAKNNIFFANAGEISKNGNNIPNTIYRLQLAKTSKNSQKLVKTRNKN